MNSKFDPEAIKADILFFSYQDFSFICPENTYTDERFPSLRIALDKQELELINLDSKGDNYRFY